MDPTGHKFTYNPGNGGGNGSIYSYTPDPSANNGGSSSGPSGTPSGTSGLKIDRGSDEKGCYIEATSPEGEKCRIYSESGIPDIGALTGDPRQGGKTDPNIDEWGNVRGGGSSGIKGSSEGGRTFYDRSVRSGDKITYTDGSKDFQYRFSEAKNIIASVDSDAIKLLNTSHIRILTFYSHLGKTGGLYDHDNKTISLNENLNSMETALVLYHEIQHFRDHTFKPWNERLDPSETRYYERRAVYAEWSLVQLLFTDKKLSSTRIWNAYSRMQGEVIKNYQDRQSKGQAEIYSWVEGIKDYVEKVYKDEINKDLGIMK